MRLIAEETVKWGALGKEALIALVAAVGIVVAAGMIIVGTSRANASRQHDRGVAALPGFVLAAVGTLVCVGALVIGLLAMIHKPS